MSCEVVVTPASLSHLGKIMTYAQQVGSNIDLLYCGKLPYSTILPSGNPFHSCKQWQAAIAEWQPGMGSERKEEKEHLYFPEFFLEPFILYNPRMFPAVI